MEILDFQLRRRGSPQGQAHARLYDILNNAAVDPLISRSDEHERLVQLILECIVQSDSDERLEDILRPLGTLFQEMRGKRGGRPPHRETWAEWARLVDQKKKHRPTLTAEERYADVASDWEAEGHAPVRWTGIRDGISKLKKLNR